MALALGLAVLALAGVLSLLPTGLQTYRTSMDAVIAAQIFQRLVAEAAGTDFEELVAREGGAVSGDYFALPQRYFDERGQEVAVADPAQPTAAENRRIIYEVRLRATRPGRTNPAEHALVFPVSLPAAPDAGGPYNPRDLTCLTVQIAVNPAHRPLPLDSTHPLLWPLPEAGGRSEVPIHTFSAMLARHGNP